MSLSAEVKSMQRYEQNLSRLRLTQAFLAIDRIFPSSVFADPRVPRLIINSDILPLVIVEPPLDGSKTAKRLSLIVHGLLCNLTIDYIVSMVRLHSRLNTGTLCTAFLVSVATSQQPAPQLNF